MRVSEGKPSDDGRQRAGQPSLDRRDLRVLGVRPGSTLLVHASLRPLGFVSGGPHAVVLALRDALGPDGTIVVPTHTPDNSDPAQWRNPPVPADWWPLIRSEMPGFDPAVTPSRFMGALAETVRGWPGALRSAHPHVSFAALGPAAEQVVAGHTLADMLGEGSPLARLYDLDADVLLLGVDHSVSTSLHLAEYRCPGRPGSGSVPPCVPPTVAGNGCGGRTYGSTRTTSPRWARTWRPPGGTHRHRSAPGPAG